MLFDRSLGYDMYSHRNGKYLNTVTKPLRGDKHVIAASRDIRPGEPIHSSYNFCSDCSERAIDYGTAGTAAKQHCQYTMSKAFSSYI